MQIIDDIQGKESAMYRCLPIHNWIKISLPALELASQLTLQLLKIEPVSTQGHESYSEEEIIGE